MEELWQARLQDLLSMEWDSAGCSFSIISFLHHLRHLDPICVGLTTSQEGVKLPPEPPGHCSKELQVTNPFKFSKGHVTRHVASSCQERSRSRENLPCFENFFERERCWWPDACVYLTTLSHFPSHFVTWAGRPVPQQQPWPPRVSTLKDLFGLQVMGRSSTKDLQDHDQQMIQIYRIQHCFRRLQHQMCEEQGLPLSKQCQTYLHPISHVFTLSLRPEGSEEACVVIHCRNHLE